MNKTNCCEKCKDYDNDSAPCCAADKDCTCHKAPEPQEAGWEKRFDDYVRTLMRRNNDMLLRSATGGFKMLFEGLLEQEKAQEIERVRAKLESIIATPITSDDGLDDLWLKREDVFAALDT